MPRFGALQHGQTVGRTGLPGGQPTFTARNVRSAALTQRDEQARQLEEFSSGLRNRLMTKPVSSLGARLVTSAHAEAQVATVQAKVEILELNQESFYPYLEASGDTLVVVDFFTDWCGPCKLMYPELVKMAEDMQDVRFTKFNCNSKNKTLGKQLGIKVAPTFQLYRKSTMVAQMTGAKVEELRELIRKHA